RPAYRRDRAVRVRRAHPDHRPSGRRAELGREQPRCAVSAQRRLRPDGTLRGFGRWRESAKHRHTAGWLRPRLVDRRREVMRRTILAGLVALALSGGGGLAAAQLPPPPITIEMMQADLAAKSGSDTV